MVLRHLGWKFMDKFAHGLGSANTFEVVEVETPSALTKLLLLLLLLGSTSKV